MQTWKLEIEYEGTRYRGWQKQQNARSVQEELETAAKAVFQSTKIELGGAGRTDAGVHALQQVAHLRLFTETPDDITPRRLQFALNDKLPHDINVLRVSNAPDRFHARHDAKMRFYLYQISTRRTAFGKEFVWWLKDRLDTDLMQETAQIFIGKHDFRSYCEAPEEQESTLVVVNSAEILTVGGMVLFRIGASHYLWKMVRRLVGTIVEVGRGNLPLAEARRFLKMNTNEPAKWTAPPSGLFLEKVLYQGDEPPSEPKPMIYLS